MGESIPLASVVPPLQSLVHRAARNPERITITDQDEPAAVVISVDELEDALAVAEARLRAASVTQREFLTRRYGVASASSGDLRGRLGATSG
jgi:PHD/YefM family antitoxin component YafN of YafNO toxin-antitoxin module